MGKKIPCLTPEGRRGKHQLFPHSYKIAWTISVFEVYCIPLQHSMLEASHGSIVPLPKSPAFFFQEPPILYKVNHKSIKPLRGMRLSCIIVHLHWIKEDGPFLGTIRPIINSLDSTHEVTKLCIMFKVTEFESQLKRQLVE